MAAADFSRSLKLVLVDEGGLSDDPHDHGGRTAHGITEREYNAYRTRRGLPPAYVWNITPAEITEIYHSQYWEPWCVRLPAGLDYVFFDFDVNAGPVQATRTLQSVLGVPVDGHMGERTINAVARADTIELIHKFSAARRNFYQHLAQYPRYGRGWMARTNHCEHSAIEIAVSGETHRVGLEDGIRHLASAKANATDVARPPATPQTAMSMAASSGIAAGFTDKLQDISSQLSQFQGTFTYIEYALVAITFVSLGFMVYGFIKEARVQKAIA